MTLRFIPVRNQDQLAQVARMAHEIWYEYYVSLVGRAQVDYMVDRFQSVPAMQLQLAEGYEYFLIERSTDAIAVGYLAVLPEVSAKALFLSKLYVYSTARGTGAGRQALIFVDVLARERGLQRVWLTVHKRNPSRFVYERLGYATTASIVTDIGGGFVMDDYRMEKILG
ncbi:MAG: GNAT family N-acetyltransferase [Steroidobacteraceae bacterium]